MWTIEQVKNELNKLREADQLPPITCPVTVNGRLTRSLGRVKFMCNFPTAIEFSRILLEEGTDNDIINVIKHEYVHYFLLITTKERHGHDAMFKAKCAEIGCTHDKARNNFEAETIGKELDITKYEVWCEDCDEIIGRYHRMCKTLKTIKYCSCGKCGSHALIVKQNW